MSLISNPAYFREKTEEDNPTEGGTAGREFCQTLPGTWICQREKEIEELCSNSSCSSCVQQLDLLLKKEEEGEEKKEDSQEKPFPGVGKFEDLYSNPEMSALRDLREVMKNMSTVRSEKEKEEKEEKEREEEEREEEETCSHPTTVSLERGEEKEKSRNLIHMSEASTRRYL